MTEYTISAFIQIMQSGFIEHNKKEAAGRLLLEAITVNEFIDFSATTITRLINREREVQDAIKKASARPEVIANAINYFKDVVVPDLNPHLQDDTFSNLIKLLEKDVTVPNKKYKELAAYYSANKIGEFLARSFLYAVSRQNKSSEQGVEVDDLPLLYEVNHNCALCNTSLLKSKNKRTLQKYSITKIYPDNLSDEDKELFQNKRQPAKKLDSYNNKIALCPNCSDMYTFDVELSDYVELFDIKEEYATKRRLQQELNNLPLEDEIEDVIHALGNIKQLDELEKFNLDVLKVNQKIRPENVILLDILKSYILKYYRFIENCFSEIGNFESIAIDIRKAFIKLEKVYKNQNEIIDGLIEWMLQLTGLPKEKRRACEIIIAFFVQNCEVFYEITE